MSDINIKTRKRREQRKRSKLRNLQSDSTEPLATIVIEVQSENNHQNVETRVDETKKEITYQTPKTKIKIKVFQSKSTSNVNIETSVHETKDASTQTHRIKPETIIARQPKTPSDVTLDMKKIYSCKSKNQVTSTSTSPKTINISLADLVRN